MRVISINTNGIRSAHRKGFYTWLARQKADFVCIQETKAQTHQLCEASFMPRSYHCNFVDAQKKGYSGVALFSRLKPDRVVRGLGWSEADAEGRFIQADFAKLSVISMYLPSGSSGEIRQALCTLKG